MNESDHESPSSPEWRYAQQTGLPLEHAELFLPDQSRFGKVVGELRRQYPDRFAHAEVLYDPPSYLVRFVGGVPAEAKTAFADLAFPVELRGDAEVSEAALEDLQHSLDRELKASGLTDFMTAADTSHGLVSVTLPKSYEPGRILQRLLSDSRFSVTTTSEPIFQPDHLGRDPR